jgi:2',3'-cyclic-nucleotide 2'-phosphodiesterase (5'-nucleotidase family)
MRMRMPPQPPTASTTSRRFGNVSFLHMTDCHAQLKPIYFREPSVNLGIGSHEGAVCRIWSASIC